MSEQLPADFKVIPAFNAIETLATSTRKESFADYYPLEAFFSEDWQEQEPSDEYQSALEVAAYTLHRLIVAGVVRCIAVAPAGSPFEGDEYVEDFMGEARLLSSNHIENHPLSWSGEFDGLFAEHIEIVISYDDLMRFIGKPSIDGGKTERAVLITDLDAPRRGPRPRFNEREFWAIVACMADLDGLPESQADFVRAIDEVLMSEWDGTPGDTWIKKRASVLYAAKAQFRARIRD